ncbi:MAG: hypothetical protein LBK62_10470 [Treponema sp.]|jgi:hypothetical protein|nr:hypothetical protein [Treponema sp.]
MKKAFVLSLCVAVCGAELFAQTAPNTVSGFEIKPDGGGVVITKYTGQGGAVRIPETIGGKPVTGIGGWAFYDCSSYFHIQPKR